MTARLGADDLDFYDSPRPVLLREITGLEPEPPGVHVLLDKHLGAQTTQRLALADNGGGIEVALWPGEQKAHALHLYRDGRAAAMIDAARDRGWSVAASPHLAFFNSHPRQRLYMAPEIDPLEYAVRWEDEDRDFIGRHQREHIESVVWPWLKQRRYASDKDDQVLRSFFKLLGRRSVDVRPGLRFRQRWDVTAVRDRSEFIAAVRRDVNAILDAGGEPTLRAS